ncbi:hypothetical protein AOZ07_11470 [Glutamicibacter halophytocola]|nr:hypothetical protein AOZ07_11470 [Glutamicibacter halophytocola]
MLTAGNYEITTQKYSAYLKVAICENARQLVIQNYIAVQYQSDQSAQGGRAGFMGSEYFTA